MFEPWQRALVAAAPWAFLRGAIRADGCLFVNRTGPYSYESYEFANHSADILDLFAETCARVGVEFRRYATALRMYRRPSVQLLLRHVGRKL